MRLTTGIGSAALTCALSLLGASAALAQTTPSTPPPYVSPIVPSAPKVAIQACNYSNGPISIAVAYQGKTAGSETVFGWYGIAEQHCELVGPFPFTSGRLAFWATRRFDDGDKNSLYCIDHEHSFTLENGRRPNDKAACPAGYDVQAFDVILADPKQHSDDTALYAWQFTP